MDNLFIYESATRKFAEKITDYDLLCLVQDVPGILENLVSCLVPQKGRLFRFFSRVEA